MLHYALVFFVVAIIAAFFGFTGIAVGAAEIAKVLFFIFLVLFVVSLVAGLLRRTPSRTAASPGRAGSLRRARGEVCPQRPACVGAFSL